VVVVAGGLRLRISRAKPDQAGQGAEIGLPRGRHIETCPVRAFEAWQAVANRKAGQLFRKISTAGRIGDAPRTLTPCAGFSPAVSPWLGSPQKGSTASAPMRCASGSSPQPTTRECATRRSRSKMPHPKDQMGTVRCGSILPLALTKSPKNQNAGSVHWIGAVRQTSDLPHTDCVWDPPPV
jgi:hypothetical protein